MFEQFISQYLPNPGHLLHLIPEFIKALQDFINLFVPSGNKARLLCLLGLLLSFSIFLTAQKLAGVTGRTTLDFKGGYFESNAFIEDMSFTPVRSVHSQGARATVGNTSSQTTVFVPDCDALLRGDEEEVTHTRAMIYREHQPSSFHLILADIRRNCTNYKEMRGYPQSAYSMEEQQFPIAYIITVHTNIEQLERLLIAIYTPQNIYCVHVDNSSDVQFQAAVRSLAKCFDNVFIASNLVNVQYGGISRLMADIHCMKDLLNTEVQWKYAINLAGQDFPLKTNYEIVLALKALKGINDIPGVHPPTQSLIDRYTYKYKLREVKATKQMKLMKTNIAKLPPPRGAHVLFGNAYYFATRGLVHYVIHDQFAAELLEWLEDAYSPDEFYWATLQKREGTPGGNVTETWSSYVRSIKWSYHAGRLYPECQGQYVRNICVYGVGDLQWLTQQTHMFANKFDINFDHMAVTCIEHWLNVKKTIQQKERIT